MSSKIQQGPDSTYRQGSVAFLKPAHDYIHTTIDDCITKANNNYFNYNIRSLEAVQFTRYQAGDYYHWHQDWLNTDNRHSRKLSLILNLSDYKDFDGGRLEFFSSTEKASGFTPVRLNGKDYNTLHFNFSSTDKKLSKDKKLNTDVWYDEKSLNWIKASFKKKGNWVYKLITIE